MRASRFVVVVWAASGLIACGDSSSENNTGVGGAGSGGTSSGTETGFSACCRGVLTSEVPVAARTGPQRWTVGDGTGKVGMELLVAVESDAWGGYVLGGDAVVVGRVATDLQLGVDFTTDCASDPARAETKRRLVLDSTFYADEDLSGPPCTIGAGADLGEVSFMQVVDGLGQVSADLISQQCGLELAYTDDMATGDLVAIP